MNIAERMAKRCIDVRQSMGGGVSMVFIHSGGSIHDVYERQYVEPALRQRDRYVTWLTRVIQAAIDEDRQERCANAMRENAELRRRIGEAEALAADRERFVGTLKKAQALLTDNRQLIVECESVGGDESTMDDDARRALVPFDVVLGEIAALLGDSHSQAELGHGTQIKTALPDEPAVAPGSAPSSANSAGSAVKDSSAGGGA